VACFGLSCLKFLRSAAGIILLDQKRSEGIRKELKFFKLTDRLDLNTKQWKQHLERLDNNRIPKKIYRRQKKCRKT
jgi:hypothetical protein